MKYDFSQIEEKWQKRWDDNHTFAATNDFTKPKYYALVESHTRPVRAFMSVIRAPIPRWIS